MTALGGHAAAELGVESNGLTLRIQGVQLRGQEPVPVSLALGAGHSWAPLTGDMNVGQTSPR